MIGGYGLALTAPELLIVGLLLIGLTLALSAAARHHLSRGRRRVSLSLRATMLAALVLALAGLQLIAPVDRLTTVFVVDLSDSVGAAGQASALAFVRDALEHRTSGDSAAVVAFGQDALVERLPAELNDIDRFASVPLKSSTDIGGALRLAGALFPDDTQKRIVLVSDGNDTTGRGQSEASLAAARGIQIETHVVGLGAADEVIVQGLKSVDTARVGENISVDATISSTVAQPATVRLYGDGTQIGVQSVNLVAGTNHVTFTVPATVAGFHTFRAVVEAAHDTFAQNNRGDSHTIVKGNPQILLIAGSDADGANLAAALQAENQQVTTLAPEQAPTDLTGFASYDSVILANVPAVRLGTARMSALQTFTRDLGHGLVMIGGPDSYGAGGYKQTPIEEALPVEMDVRDKQRQPDVALVVVIDESGSMAACHCNTANRDTGVQIQGVPKVDIGKEAIIRAVTALTSRDEFGVVAFNENAHWVINTAPLGTEGDVESQLAAIHPDGQTNIYAGLSEAVASLEKATATRRHIVLFTDGWSHSGDYTALLQQMAAAGITLSTVGTGGGNAGDVLSQLAQQGGGRYYPATDPTTIPDIFLKETQQVSGQQIVEEPFFPAQTSDSPILDEITSGLPQLLGYNGTTVKPAAQQVLASNRDDPVLAQWQYGLGRAVAWTSDASGRWASSWVGWSNFNRFFSQLVRWTFPGDESGGMEAEFVSDGDNTKLVLHSVETDGTPRNFYDTTVNITDPTFDTREAVRLDQTAPGVYETDLGTLTPGAYALRFMQTKPGSTALGRTAVLIAPTPAEYLLLGTNEHLLAALRAATGGREVTAGADAWLHDLGTTTAATDLWPLLVLLALLLWPVDVGVRRLSVTGTDVGLARDWVGSRWRAWRGPARRPQAVGGMLAAKDRAGGRQARSGLVRSPKPPIASAPAPGPARAPEAPPDPESKATPAEAAETDAAETDTLSRLRAAKRRARGPS